ncbi:hypothetical protein TNCV_983201 [Trichonephila clavipes]|nr:hypothetical protein TNCV_983201 [Trichonephila clavipes]
MPGSSFTPTPLGHEENVGVGLGHQSLLPTYLGRMDEEMSSLGDRLESGLEEFVPVYYDREPGRYQNTDTNGVLGGGAITAVLFWRLVREKISQKLPEWHGGDWLLPRDPGGVPKCFFMMELEASRILPWLTA